MTDVLRGRDGGFPVASPFQAWIDGYLQGRYTEVARDWQDARVRPEYVGFPDDARAVEAVGWSLALTKQWEPYAIFRADLTARAAHAHSELLAVLDGWRCIHDGRYDACLHRVRGARAALVAPGGPARILGHALKVEGVALFRLARYDEAEAAMRRALEIFQLGGDLLSISHCATNLGLILNARGEIRAARTELQRAVDALLEADAAGERLALARVNLGVVELHLGNVAAARALFESTLQVFTELGLTSEAITARNGLGHCGRVLGDFEAAEQHYRAALDLTDEHMERQAGLGHEFLGQLCCDRGDRKRAERHYRRALDIAAQIAPDGDLMLEVCWHYAELLAASGRRREARDYVQRAEAMCDASRERRELGCVQRARARLLAVDGDPAAGAAFETAHATLLQTGRMFEAALTRLAHAECEAARGAHGTASDLLAEAAAAFAQLWPGSAWVQRCEAALAQLRRAPGAQALPQARYGFWTRDADTLALLEELPALAATRWPILLEGESGTGKELLARAVHSTADRSGIFVAINCAAVPRDLFESELFGHVRGAFSGAGGDKPGLFEQAANGTLLLDEIGDMPIELQVKLLRVLDDGLVRRLGDVRERPVQVKVVAATNRPLEAAVASGAFRIDLFHRLAVHHVRIKPLRERAGDLELLCRVLLRQEGLEDRVQLDPETLAMLAARDWPGNVRELRNHLLRLATRAAPAEGAAAARGASASLRSTRSEHERRVIEATLAAAGGNVGEAARSLRLHATTLRRKMRALGVDSRRD